MLETIISWILQVIGEGFEAIINIFLSSIRVDLGYLADIFPMLVTGYKIFQAIGVGLTVAIASWQAFKFFGGQLSDTRDTPVQVLLRAAISGSLIFLGGNVVELCVDVSRMAFTTMEVPDAIGFSITDFQKSLIGSDATNTIGIAIGPATLLVLTLIVILLIGWNVVKLIVEVCERYLLIGVLAYAAPLMYPFLASKSTSDVFKRFVSMFLGQCALITISAWFLKLALSGFSVMVSDSSPGLFYKFILTLALCKIAQRADTYMQQLGIGVATTGGNLLDEAIGMVAVLSNARGRAGAAGGGLAAEGGSRTAVLGAGADGNLSRMGGLFGGLSNAVQHGVRDYKAGADISEIGRSVVKGFGVGSGIDIGKKGESVVNAIRSGKVEGMTKTSEDAIKSAVLGFMGSGAVTNRINTARNARAAAMEAAKNQAAGAVGKGAQGGFAQTAHGPLGNAENPIHPQGGTKHGVNTMAEAGEAVRNEYKEWRDQNPGASRAEFMDSNFANLGAGKFGYDDNNNFELDAQAQKSGLNIRENPNGASFVDGTDDRVAAFISNNYGFENAQNETANAMLTNTVKESSPAVSEAALFNPDNELSGNDALGNALIEKTFGNASEITGFKDAQFTNIHKSAGSSVVHADFFNPESKRTQHFELHQRESIDSGAAGIPKERLGAGIMGNLYPVEARGSGQKIYIKRSLVDISEHRMEDPNRVKASRPRVATRNVGSSRPGAPRKKK